MATRHQSKSINSKQLAYSDEDLPSLLEQLREKAPILKKDAPVSEELRSLGAATVAVFDELELWGIMIPRRWGGRGMSTSAMFEINRAVGRSDMSASWVLQIINGTGWIASLTSDELQEDVFGDGIPRICSAVTPPGTAVPVEGGYLVSGAWPYSSGSQQATWGQFGVSIKAADGSLSHGNLIYIPRSDFEIDPTWYCVGLTGTGSDTAVAKDVFVPHHRLVPASKSFDFKDPARKHFGAPSDYWPVTTQIRTTSLGMKIGAAETMLEMVKEQVKTKPIVTTAHSPAATSQVVQMEIGAAAAKISAALQIGQRATGILDDAGLDARVLTAEERAMLKGEHGLAFELLSEATNRLMYVAGSSAFQLKNDLQRYWRDLNVAARHVAYLPNIGYELYGRSLLQIEPNVIPFGGY